MVGVRPAIHFDGEPDLVASLRAVIQAKAERKDRMTINQWAGLAYSALILLGLWAGWRWERRSNR